MRLALIVSFVLSLAALAACGGSGDSATNGEPVSPVRGLLTRVEDDGSGQAQEIVLRADDGRSWTFAVELDPAAPVDAAHLRLHVEQELPVLVAFTGRGDSRTAYRIDDAP